MSATNSASTPASTPEKASANTPAIADGVPVSTWSLEDAVLARRSVRGFLPTPVPPEVRARVFSLAQQAPSNCNIQPWHVVVVSGAPLRALEAKLVDEVSSGRPTQPDFARVDQFEGVYRRRQVDTAAALYGNMGIARGDKAGRRLAMLRNYEFFDAPHCAFIFMPRQFGATVALDVGMYAQTLMLAMTAHGISSCAQASIGRYPAIVREHLGVDENLGLLMALSFGYEDPAVAANRTRVPRAPVEQEVRFVE